MSKKNLVAYNADRIIKIVKRVDKEGQYPLMEDYDSVIHILDFVKEELEQNYNPKADLKCSHCKRHFTGLHAYDQQINHEIKKHKNICDAQMVLMFGTLSCLMDGLIDYKWLYKETGSQVALALHKLHKKGKDLPVELLRQYQKDSDDYFDMKDPERRWHKPSEYKYPEGLDAVPGRNTIIKETRNAVAVVLKGKILPSKKTVPN